MHQILGAAQFNLSGAWVGSYYGRVTQQGTCTKKKDLQVCVLHTHIRTWHVRRFVWRKYLCVHELSCVCMHTYMQCTIFSTKLHKQLMLMDHS
jgi:hypothetical protein